MYGTRWLDSTKGNVGSLLDGLHYENAIQYGTEQRASKLILNRDADRSGYCANMYRE